MVRVFLALGLGLLAWRSEAQRQYQLKTGQIVRAAGFASVQSEGISFRTSGVGVVSKRYRWTEFTPDSLRQLYANIQEEKRITLRPDYPSIVQVIQKVLQSAGPAPIQPRPTTTNATSETNKAVVQPGGMTVTMATPGRQKTIQRPTGLPENFSRTFGKSKRGISYPTLAGVVLLLLGTVGFGVFQTIRFYGKMEADRLSTPHAKSQAVMEAAQAEAETPPAASTADPPPPASETQTASAAPPPSTADGIKVYTRAKSTFNRRFMEMKMMNFLKLHPAGNEYLVVKVEGQEIWGRRIAGLSEESMTLEVAVQNVWEQQEVSYEDIDEIAIQPTG